MTCSSLLAYATHLPRFANLAALFKRDRGGRHPRTLVCLEIGSQRQTRPSNPNQSMLESTNIFRNFQQFNLSVLFWSLSFIFVYKTSVSGAVALADALRQNSTLEHLAASVVDRNPRSRSFIVVNCTRDQCHFDFYLFKIHNLYICNMYIHDSLPCETANCVKPWESNHGNWRLFI